MNFTMKASEVRIGSYYSYKGNIIRLSDDDLPEIKHNLLSLLEPIELNEEWLKRCGFERNEDAMEILEYSKGVFTLVWSQRFECYMLWKNYGATTDCHIMNLEYVHTLQNIWPLLNLNEELEINE